MRSGRHARAGQATRISIDEDAGHGRERVPSPHWIDAKYVRNIPGAHR